MESMVLENERRLAVPVARARMVIIRSLRSQGFTMTSEQVSLVAARRGSQLVGSVHPKKLPLSATVTFETVEGGCRLGIRLADMWKSPVGKVWGMNGPYQQVMAEVQAELDAVLTPIAWHGERFETDAMQSATADVAFLTRGNTAVTTTGGAVIAKAEDRLAKQPDGGPPKTLTEVVFRGSKGVASFDRGGVQGLLTVGLLVSMKPGSMPPNLAADVERLSAKIEQAIKNQPVGRLNVELSDKELPVAEFLAKQASLRDMLPLRILHVCTTCQFEKIVNPDFERLQALNQKKKALTGLVGASISSKGISPFVLVGSLLKFKTEEIPFVCPRCQGLQDDTSVVTFCPQCGERRDEAVLRNCQRCRYAFTAHASAGDGFWRTETIPWAPPTSPVVPQAMSASPLSVPLPTPVATPVTKTPSPEQRANRQAQPESLPPPGWYADTTRRHQHRYWNGTSWTSHVADNGTPSEDPEPVSHPASPIR